MQKGGNFPAHHAVSKFDQCHIQAIDKYRTPFHPQFPVIFIPPDREQKQRKSRKYWPSAEG